MHKPLLIAIILISVLLILFIIYLIVGSIIFTIIFKRKKSDYNFAQLEDIKEKNKPNRVWLFAQEIEEISMKSYDNLLLKGYFLNNNSNKLVIIAHGYRGRYYSSSMQAHLFFNLGYDVFLPNNRAHDTSEGSYFTMGPKEEKDMLSWINLMIKRNPNYQIVLFGVSMGAHIMMITSSNAKLPNNVKCLVEDCGYASLRSTLIDQMHQSFPLPLCRLFTSACELYCLIFKHFNFSSSTSKRLKNSKIPSLFIHGDIDERVIFKNLDINYNAMIKDVDHEKVIFKGVAHNKAYEEEEKYSKVIKDFVSKYIQ